MIIISIIYILLQIVLFSGIFKFFKNKTDHSGKLQISIITAARNEVNDIEDYLSAIKRLNYAGDNYELIISDDNSSDGTFEAVQKIIKGHKNYRITAIEDNTGKGKRQALLKGIKISSYPYIVITDADCRPSPEWLKCCSGMFEKGYDFIFGPAPFYRENSFINDLSCMENLKNSFLSFSLSSLGIHYTAAARNMGISKEAFFRIGGYRNTTDTTGGDDDLLLREALRHNLKIKAFYDENALVYSRTKNTLKEYVKQKARHTQTSLHYLLINKIILGTWHLLNLFMLFSVILIFLNINFIWLFILKITADITIMTAVQKKFGYAFNLFEMIYLDILYEIFIIVNFFNAIFRKTEW